MALLNGLSENSRGFIVTLGKVAGGLNAIALAALAIGLIMISLRYFSGKPQFPAVEKHKQYEIIKKYAPCLIPLGLVMIFTAWRVMAMTMANNEFAGIIGITALAKTILL
jgi:hypothetical protein